MNERELVAWYEDVNRRLKPYERDSPACWGGQFRTDDNGTYVPAEAMAAALESSRELDLWYCLAYRIGCGCGAGLSEINEHQDDAGWLAAEAESLVDGPIFYTEYLPEDYDYGELVDLADKRPDLFNGEDIYDPVLVRPAMEAGLLQSIGGERAWVGGQDDGWFAWPRKESELREHFSNCPDLADEREAGTTYEDWIYDNEQRGLLVATDSLPLCRLTETGLERAWASFSDVPIDDDGRIEGRWRTYPQGTPRKEILHDFDTAHAMVRRDGGRAHAPATLAHAASLAAADTRPIEADDIDRQRRSVRR